MTKQSQPQTGVLALNNAHMLDQQLRGRDIAPVCMRTGSKTRDTLTSLLMLQFVGAISSRPINLR